MDQGRLTSLATLSQGSRPRARADARWALGQIGASPQSLGLVRRDPLPLADPHSTADLVAHCEEAEARVDEVVAAIWRG